jgi:hypothetical protein
MSIYDDNETTVTMDNMDDIFSENSVPTDAASERGGETRLVIAIDYGTTYTGLFLVPFMRLIGELILGIRRGICGTCW